MTLRERAEKLESELSSKWHDPKFLVENCRTLIEQVLREVAEEMREKCAVRVHKKMGCNSVAEETIRMTHIE